MSKNMKLTVQLYNYKKQATDTYIYMFFFVWLVCLFCSDNHNNYEDKEEV